MERRFFLAIILMTAVVVAPSFFRQAPPPESATADSGQGSLPDGRSAGRQDGTSAEPDTVAAQAAVEDLPSYRPADLPPEDTVLVSSGLYRYAFSTRGARMVGATLLEYKNTVEGQGGAPVQMLAPDGDLLGLRLVAGRDTVALDDWDFVPSALAVDVASPATLGFRAQQGGVVVDLTYHFDPEHYRVAVDGRVEGLGPNGAQLLIGMGPGMVNTERDSTQNVREMGIVTMQRSTDLTRFQSLDPGEVRLLSGPFRWVAVKSKYFVTALFTADSTRPQISGATVRAEVNGGKPHHGSVWLGVPLPQAGGFGYTLYAGPMEYPRLKAMGDDFDDVNPYGWPGIRTLIRVFAVPVRAFLVWMHEALHLHYGIVLILLGFLVRAVLWPLNQKAMRSSMAMQAIQGPMKELQNKYKENPQRLQQEMMKLYKEHGVNPLGGCLPMLLPMPVLFALFFVLQSTIELRGVPFLWFPDLSLPDPLYIIPVLSGISMFALSKVGQMGIEYTPETRMQAKLMLWFLPGMITFFGFQFASGLNLYWFASNVASIPQQWLIARERMALKPVTASKVEVGTKPGAGQPGKRKGR